MSIAKRVAYLKGLAEGLGLGEDTKEEKILNVIIDILEDISLEIEDLEEDVLNLDDDISELCDDVQNLEDIIFEEDELDDMDDEPLFYEVKCPSCENEITIDEDVLDLGSIECPNCGETLEFDLSSLDDGDIESDDGK